jgi:hypothetical protein
MKLEFVKNVRNKINSNLFEILLMLCFDKIIIISNLKFERSDIFLKTSF